MNYKRKIKWIVIILFIVIVTYGLKVFFTPSNRGQTGIQNENGREVLLSPLTSNNSEFKLVKIELGTLCCKAANEDAAISCIEEMKKDANWIKTKKSGEIILAIQNDEGDVVKKIKVNGGDSINKYFWLDGEKQYSVILYNKDFRGYYEYYMYSYNIF